VIRTYKICIGAIEAKMITDTSFLSAYCERTDAGFWAEPFNAVSNLAFIIVALLAARALMRQPGLSLRQGWDRWLLVGLLVCIGVGSFLWHTFATPWAEWADKIPILIFISLFLLVFLFRVAALNGFAVVGWFVLYHIANFSLQSTLPADFWNGSVFYLPTLLALYVISLYAVLSPHLVARYLLITSVLLSVSLLMRSVDFVLCDWLPVGTHFIWHLLNALLLYTAILALLPPVRYEVN